MPPRERELTAEYIALINYLKPSEADQFKRRYWEIVKGDPSVLKFAKQREVFLLIDNFVDKCLGGQNPAWVYTVEQDGDDMIDAIAELKNET